MSIRLDPRRVATLKQLAADAGMRPGDLVRQWVEERIDAARGGAAVPAGAAASGLAERVEALTARVAALEAVAGVAEPAPSAEPEFESPPPADIEADTIEPSATGEQDDPSMGMPEADEPSEPEPADELVATGEAGAEPAPKRTRRNAVAAAPPGGRVALHDEMIEVLRERGPMTAGELAGAIAERGRYAPPRSGKPLDAAMVSQRVSNPTYRSRFVRQDGRIGLAE